MITFHPLFLSATPTNAVAASLALLIAVLLLYLIESPPANPLIFAGFFGIVIGMMAATRLATAAIFAIVSAVVWLHLISLRYTIIMSGFAFLAAYVFDPLLWFKPIDHLSFVLFRSSLNFTDSVHAARLSIEDFLLFTPFGILSVALGSALLLTTQIQPPMRRLFLICILALTTLFATVFLSVQSQSMRHFLPIIFIWEFFLPLFLFHLIAHIRDGRVQGMRLRFLLMSSLGGLLVVTQILFLTHALTLPKWTVVPEFLHPPVSQVE